MLAVLSRRASKDGPQALAAILRDARKSALLRMTAVCWWTSPGAHSRGPLALPTLRASSIVIPGCASWRRPCPGRGAARSSCGAVHRRAGSVTDAGACYGPGSAKHHAAKGHSASKTRVNALMVLHRARDTGTTSGFRVRAKTRAPE